MLKTLDWKSLQDRRREARLTMMYKTDNQIVSIDNQQRVPTAVSPGTCTQSFLISSDYRN